jgi:Uri superfamily endonuclease
MNRPMPAETAYVLKRLGIRGAVPDAETGNLPAEPGAYGILLRLKEHLPLVIPRLGNPELLPGLYLYCGSAKGPGGVRARVKRHLCLDKTRRWHIDHVTGAAPEIAGFAALETSECQLRLHASRELACDVPVAGFGSSDCRTCPSHFLKL